MPTSYNKLRILRNTTLLYGRMLFTVWLNLWATRLTLQHLGVDDLGVYGVIGSVVTMFGVLTNGITTAVQRFITFELGKGDGGKVNQVFSTSLNVLLLFSLVLVVLLEVLGVWLLDTRLDIPEGSMAAAHWVFQFSVLAFVFGMIAIPYNALVIAHERMGAFAAISVLQVFLNCMAAWSLSLFSSHRLVIYGALMAVIAVLVRLIYQCYCHLHFPEARYRWGIDRGAVLEMSRFAGVSTLSGVFQMLTSEGLMLVINWTFGVALNAVYAIALQLKNMVLSFALNIFKAIQPQITKTYAEGDFSAHKHLVYYGSKLEVFLVYFLLLPFLCRTQQVMQLWLGPVPAHAVAFVRGTIFLSLTYAAFEPIRTAVLATGRITRFMLIPEGFFLLVLPVSYLIARVTDSPDLMLLSIVVMDVLACVLRVWLGTRVSPLEIDSIFEYVLVPCLAVGFFGGIACWMLSTILPVSFLGLVFLLILNSLALLAIIIVFQQRLVKQVFLSLRPRL